MRFELFNKETNKIWNNVSGGQATDRMHFELEIYKKLLNFFQVGDYYYVIFNISKLDFEFVSPQVLDVLGYKPSIFNVNFFMELIHPDDRSWLLTFEAAAAKFVQNVPLEKLMKYKVRYDYRLKHNNGAYIHILHQSAVVEHDKTGGIIRTLSVETDITHLKKVCIPVLSFIGMDGEPSYVNIDTKNNFLKIDKTLTARERQILLL